MVIKYDGKFDIAIGKSRRDKHWKKKKMLWSELVDRLQVTHYTDETHADYMAGAKDFQDSKKDVGGFVGGYINGGRRLSGSVMHRQLITLDIDFAKADIWEDITTIYGNAAIMYSTHKHSADSPRLRLIMPLNREVKPDEYQAIARAIAGVIDIEIFDPTTFQPERLMYWPSTSKDGQYLFHYIDGPWINADEVLSTYIDWRDSSEWPVSSKVDKIVQRGIAKQGDPHEKKGVIGAFCRTYSIEEVIDKYLSDVYEACDNGRYTYREGSTSAGLVIYDDKFAYSHHGTDPISGKLCNAFDLVRIHKFGLLDENCREETADSKKPSFKAISELAMADKEVRRLIGEEKLSDAKEEFSDYFSEDDDFEEDPEDEEGQLKFEPTEESDPSETWEKVTKADKKKGKKGADADADADTEWLGKMKVDGHGDFLGSIGNIAMILDKDPMLAGAFGYDTFSNKKVILKHLPWRKVNKENRLLKDEDKQNLHKYLEIKYGINNRSNAKDAFDTHINSHSFHPIRDYLNSLQWDGENRVDTVFIDYLGAEDSELNRAMTRKSLVAAVARVFNPGVKFDHILTTIGMEGIGKSTVLQKLGGEWFSDSFSFNMLKNEIRAYEQIQGAWLIEIGEVSGLKKAESEEVKHFVAKRADSFRGAYRENGGEFKRQCVFFATTEEANFLQRVHGNRRWWPMPVGVEKPEKSVFNDLTKAVVNQIWAEAKIFYEKGEKLFLDPDMEMQARERQKAHSEIDDRIGMVENYLNTPVPDNWDEMDIYQKRDFLRHGDELQKPGTIYRKRVCTHEIWCELFGGTERDFGRRDSNELHNIMRQIDGWERYTTQTIFKNYGNQRGYFRTQKTIDKMLKKALENEFLEDD